MYSSEIANLLRIRNYLISNKEYFNICSTSPQIKSIAFQPNTQDFYISTKDNYDFNFKVYRKS